jgi:hypothetical protein
MSGGSDVAERAGSGDVMLEDTARGHRRILGYRAAPRRSTQGKERRLHDPEALPMVIQSWSQGESDRSSQRGSGRDSGPALP